jgi:hypothetical protein
MEGIWPDKCQYAAKTGDRNSFSGRSAWCQDALIRLDAGRMNPNALSVGFLGIKRFKQTPPSLSRWIRAFALR